MKIGLLDIDSHNFPNLPLMKISAYHKRRGDIVEPFNALTGYDKVYVSKIFGFTSDFCYPIQAPEVVYGGTGYNLASALPAHTEHIYPDYSLYGITDTAYGFLARGCPRQCPFCNISSKEGVKSQRVADLSEFWNGQRNIKLLDPNLLACADREAILQQLIDSRAYVDFTQGLDIRLATDDIVDLLTRVRVKRFHFAWDNPQEDLTGYFQRFKRLSGITDYRKLCVYVLTNYNSTHEEDLYRITALRDLGFWPYVMIYNKATAPSETRQVQRWVNNRFIFQTVKTFAEYEHTRA